MDLGIVGVPREGCVPTDVGRDWQGIVEGRVVRRVVAGRINVLGMVVRAESIELRVHVLALFEFGQEDRGRDFIVHEGHFALCVTLDLHGPVIIAVAPDLDDVGLYAEEQERPQNEKHRNDHKAGGAPPGGT